MSDYATNKKEIDKIRNEFGCQGELIFRTAIQCVMEYGQRTFKNHNWLMEQMAEIDDRHDQADKEGKHLFISRDFEKAIIECGEALARVDTYDLLIYIQKEVWLGGEDISYQRAIDLLYRCIDSIDFNYSPLDAIRSIGFRDNEIAELGFQFLLDNEEE